MLKLNKFCRWFNMNESRQNYLDSVSNQIENQLSDLCLDYDEIIYVCNNIYKHCIDKKEMMEYWNND